MADSSSSESDGDTSSDDGGDGDDGDDGDTSSATEVNGATGRKCLSVKVASEGEAATELLKRSHEYVRRLTREEYMVLLPDKVWRSMNQEKAVKEVGVRVVEAELRWKGKKNVARVHHHETVAVSNQIAKQMLRVMRETPSFTSRLQTSAYRRLFYRGGFYDFTRGRFTCEEGADIPTASRIPMKFPNRPGEAKTQEFMNRVLIPIFPIEDEREAFLTYLARGLAGEVTEKLWSVFIGERNVGKGVLTDALKAAFPRAVCDLRGRHLMQGLEVEAEREFAFALDKMEHSAIVICNEMPSHGNIDGDKIKTLGSGGDALSARHLYAEARDFVPRGRLLICANKLPRVVPDDATKTMAWFTGRTEFVLDKSELTARQTAANAAFELDPLSTPLRYCLGDSNMKFYVKSKDAVRAFTHIVLDAYRGNMEDGRPLNYMPDYVLEPGRAGGATESTESVIAEMVVATGVKKDFVAEEDIKRMVRARTRQPIEHSRIETILTGLSRDAGIDEKEHASATLRGVAGNRIQGWRFVRERTPAELVAFRDGHEDEDEAAALPH
jgi:hypothetical protein